MRRFCNGESTSLSLREKKKKKTPQINVFMFHVSCCGCSVIREAMPVQEELYDVTEKGRKEGSLRVLKRCA